MVGIGPGDPAWRTPEASAALAEATDIVGYGLYLDLLGRTIAGKNRHASALGEEEARVRQALDLAAEGRSVALVSSGDAGIYGLASLVFELLDRAAKPEWRTVELVVCPGVSAMQAAAARAGAPARPRFLRDLALRPDDPVGDDPRAGSKPRRRPISSSPSTTRARRAGRRGSPRRPRSCCAIARRRPRSSSAAISAATARSGISSPLSELAGAEIDMLTLVLVGSRTTRRLDGDPPRLYTPRGYLDRDAG